MAAAKGRQGSIDSTDVASELEGLFGSGSSKPSDGSKSKEEPKQPTQPKKPVDFKKEAISKKPTEPNKPEKDKADDTGNKAKPESDGQGLKNAAEANPTGIAISRLFEGIEGETEKSAGFKLRNVPLLKRIQMAVSLVHPDLPTKEYSQAKILDALIEMAKEDVVKNGEKSKIIKAFS